MRKKNVLFICTHNSCRSQMAEGWLRNLYGEQYTAFSAGTEKTRVKPMADRVMKEAGVDISSQYSKTKRDLTDVDFDIIITVCDRARNTCPMPPNGKAEIMHKSFFDPSDVQGTEQEKLEAFRKTRDEIREWVKQTFNPDHPKHNIR